MVTSLIKSPWLAFFLLVLFSVIQISTASAAEIRATVDRNPIPVGESFQLVIDAIGSIDEDPDFRELQKMFRILNSGQSSNFSLINGSIKRNKTWTMVLIAEKPGTYIIPAISFGKDRSRPIKIKIVASSVNSSDKKDDIFLEVEVKPKSVYVQQQLIYTIKLYTRIRLANASLSEPMSEDNQAIINKLGDDINSQVTINGVGYSVISRSYAIFPQKSGALKIAPVSFETQIPSNTRQRSFFNMDPFSSRGTIKRLKSKAVEIKVKGIPAEFTSKYPSATWLPVDKLTITDSWSGDLNSFKSGEPMTRTINLTAQNLSAAQLPDIKFTTPKGIKSYPDVPVVDEQRNSKGLIANKQFKTALLATRVGKQHLSEIIIPWWSTATNSIQESVVASQTINVIANADNESDVAPVLKLEEPKLDFAVDNLNESEKILVQSEITSTMGQPLPIIWIITSTVFALLWFITLYLFLSMRSKLKNNEVKANTVKQPAGISTKHFKNACLDNDAIQSSQSLLLWANSQTETEQFTNLAALKLYSSEELRERIKELQHYLYSNNASDWEGSQLWSAFKKQPPAIKKYKKSNKKSLKLPSLYANYD